MLHTIKSADKIRRPPVAADDRRLGITHTNLAPSEREACFTARGMAGLSGAARRSAAARLCSGAAAWQQRSS